MYLLDLANDVRVKQHLHMNFRVIFRTLKVRIINNLVSLVFASLVSTSTISTNYFNIEGFLPGLKFWLAIILVGSIQFVAYVFSTLVSCLCRKFLSPQLFHDLNFVVLLC